MRIRLNGSPKELDPALTVAGLLAVLGLGRDGIAVAVNRQVVPRSAHESHVLAEGDDVELIQAVGGG